MPLQKKNYHPSGMWIPKQELLYECHHGEGQEGRRQWTCVFSSVFICRSVYMLFYISPSDHVFSRWAEPSWLPGMIPILAKVRKVEFPKLEVSLVDFNSNCKLTTDNNSPIIFIHWWSLVSGQSLIWAEMVMISVKQKVSDIGLRKKGCEKTCYCSILNENVTSGLCF